MERKGRWEVLRQHLRGAVVGTVKYEKVNLKAYANTWGRGGNCEHTFRFYNVQRPHQTLGHRTPAEVFHGNSAFDEKG